MPFLSSWSKKGNGGVKPNYVNADEPPYHDPAGPYFRRWTNESQIGPEVEPRRWRSDWQATHPQTPMRTRVRPEILAKIKPVFEGGQYDKSVTASLPTKDTWGAENELEPPQTVVEIPDDEGEEESMDGLGSLGKFKMPKILRGKSANRVLNVVLGPLAPVGQAVRAAALGKKSSLAQGNIKIPAAVQKAVKKIPVINKLPGVQKGFIGVKELLGPKMLLAPVKAITAELKKKKTVAQQTPTTQVSAEAISAAAEQVADQTGQSQEQVIENPETSEIVTAQAQQNLYNAQTSIQEQLYEGQQEQAIRQEEILQVSSPSPEAPVVPGARPKDQIMEEMRAVALEVLQAQGIEPTEENIVAVSEEVYAQWMEGQNDEIAASQAEQEYLQAEYNNAQAAQAQIQQVQEEGGVEGLLALLR